MSRVQRQIRKGNTFVSRKTLEEYYLKIYKIDPHFYEHYRKKILLDESGCKCI